MPEPEKEKKLFTVVMESTIYVLADDEDDARDIALNSADDIDEWSLWPEEVMAGDSLVPGWFASDLPHRGTSRYGGGNDVSVGDMMKKLAPVKK